MAMRFAQVDEKGKYSKKAVSDAAQKIAYITMMQVRSYIVNEAGKNLAKACTIIIRYSAVRRQGYAEDGKTELQILDYKQQQHRIFPLLAASYCFFFTGKKLLSKLQGIEKKLLANEKVAKAEVTDIHASSSGLKSFTTMMTADGMEDCRRACGGHGFLQSSGLPELVTTYLQSPTVEGDNHMLPQQVVKVLLKLIQAIHAGDDLKEYESCDSYNLVPSLKNILSGIKEVCRASSEEDMMDLNLLLDSLRHRASRLLIEVASMLKRATEQGKSLEEAWNEALIEMARTSRAYSQFLLILNFLEGIQEEHSIGSISKSEVEVLQELARLLSFYWIEREIGDFLEDGFFSSKQSHYVRRCVLRSLDNIRPNAVALVDARDFSDFRLKSALGRYDGDVYPAVLDAAKRDPLNQSEPGPGYEEHLKRLIVGGVGVYTGTSSRL